MNLRFDRTAAGEGVEAQCRLESGKALLEWHFCYENGEPGRDFYVKLRLTDKEERLVLECLQQTGEEEPLKSVLLHPQLWQGVDAPYLYRLEAEIFSQTGERTDRYSRAFSLYTLTHVPGKGLLLNGEFFCPKTVRYRLQERKGEAPEQGGTSQKQRSMLQTPERRDTAQMFRELLRDLQLARQAGANGILVEGTADRTFRALCERMGFLVWDGERHGGAANCLGGGAAVLPGDGEAMLSGGDAPLLRGNGGSLLKPDGTPASLFYRYRANWSRCPFVYIVPESVMCRENGTFSVSVYSSCKKVALYVDGVLHAFLTGEEEFVFHGIVPSGPCLALTAEAEECAQSLSVHRTFTKLSLFHDI